MMKSIRFLFYLLCCVLASGHALEARAGNEKSKESQVLFADPFIFYHDGLYYAYGTSSFDGIEALVSTDLEHWQVPGGGKRHLALHKEDVYGETWFWAPEVYQIDGKFYMYYSGDERICVAMSDSPLGPFKQVEKKPMYNEKAIDHTLFIDDDGKSYLFFVRFNDGLNVWVAELEKDKVTLKEETLHPCIKTSQPWEKTCGGVNEGPFVMKRDGRYYMTYSANSFTCQDYGIGCATATDLMGKWTKYDENPLLQNEEGLVGIGHNALFTDKDGKLRIVYHAHKDKSNIHPRAMYIGDVRFEKVKGTDRMRIGKKHIVAKISEK